MIDELISLSRGVGVPVAARTKETRVLSYTSLVEAS